MVKSIKNISDILKIENQKDLFDQDVFNIIKIIKEESGLVLKNKDILIKKNIIKIKSDSNIRFLILLFLNKINKKLNQQKCNFIVEL